MQTNIPSNLQANSKQVRSAPDKYNTKYYIEAITFDLSQKDNHIWNDMIAVDSDNFAQVSATQTEFWCKLHYEIQAKTNKEKYEVKRHKGNPTMQQNRRSRHNKVWLVTCHTKVWSIPEILFD